MKELTTREILEYAVKIETESFAFYSLAAEAMTDKDLKTLCQDLAEQEKGHRENIRAVLRTIPGDTTVPAATGLPDHLIAHGTIAPGATPHTILMIALEREMNTRQFYASMLALTDLNPDIVDLFNALLVQEDLHAQSVQKRLARLG